MHVNLHFFYRATNSTDSAILVLFDYQHIVDLYVLEITADLINNNLHNFRIALDVINIVTGDDYRSLNTRIYNHGYDYDFVL